jgi:hypothetical protein
MPRSQRGSENYDYSGQQAVARHGIFSIWKLCKQTFVELDTTKARSATIWQSSGISTHQGLIQRAPNRLSH